MITPPPQLSWPCLWGPRPWQVPACRWRGQQDSRTAVPRLAFPQCVPAVSAPAFSGAASPSRGARQAAHAPRGSELAFSGSALGWHCGLVRIPWRRQNSPLCRCELGIHGQPGTHKGTEGAGSGVTPAPASLAGLCTGEGAEIGCVQMVSVKRSQFLLSPPLSPVTSSVISVLPGSGGSHTSLQLPHACPGLAGGRQIQPLSGLILGCKRGSFGAGRPDSRHLYPGRGSPRMSRLRAAAVPSPGVGRASGLWRWQEVVLVWGLSNLHLP